MLQVVITDSGIYTPAGKGKDDKKDKKDKKKKESKST
jgi:hypothetical protein